MPLILIAVANLPSKEDAPIKDKPLLPTHSLTLLANDSVI